MRQFLSRFFAAFNELTTFMVQAPDMARRPGPPRRNGRGL
jgi:hypothetical protein